MTGKLLDGDNIIAIDPVHPLPGQKNSGLTGKMGFTVLDAQVFQFGGES